MMSTDTVGELRGRVATKAEGATTRYVSTTGIDLGGIKLYYGGHELANDQDTLEAANVHEGRTVTALYQAPARASVSNASASSASVSNASASASSASSASAVTVGGAAPSGAESGDMWEVTFRNGSVETVTATELDLQLRLGVLGKSMELFTCEHCGVGMHVEPSYKYHVQNQVCIMKRKTGWGGRKEAKEKNRSTKRKKKDGSSGAADDGSSNDETEDEGGAGGEQVHASTAPRLLEFEGDTSIA